ncbi:MAG: hypothetical protein WCR31_08505 [Treponema sp.]
MTDFETAVKTLEIDNRNGGHNIKVPDIKKIKDLKERDRLVIRSYGPMLRFAQACKKRIRDGELTDDQKKDVIIALAHMVYGWMPTMLRMNEEQEKDSEYSICSHPDYFWKKIDDGTFFDNKEGSEWYKFFAALQKTVNNSVVGASKLLHFIEPELYAIYDLRVYKSIVKPEEKISYGKVNKIENYLAYNKKLLDLTVDEKNKDKLERMRNELKYKGFIPSDSEIAASEIKEVSFMRCMELCLYLETDEEEENVQGSVP